MNKLNPIKYIENMLSHHPKSFYLWITDGIVIDDKRYIIKEFRLRDGKLYAVIAENKYNPKYFEVQLCPDEETLKAIYKAIEDNKVAIKKEITDRKNEIARVDAAIKVNTTKINQEITDRTNEITRVDNAIKANTAKINKEITDRTNEVTRLDKAINANTAKINQEITDRENEINRVDAAIKANTAKINQEITDRTDEITRVDAAINKEISDRTSEITRVDNVVKSNTAKIDKEIVDRKSEIARVDKAIKDNKGSIDQEVTNINNAINANTTKINQEITNRQNEINRVDGVINSNTTKINQEIADRKSEINRVNTAIDSNTTKINKEITDRTSEVARLDKTIKDNKAAADQTAAGFNTRIESLETYKDGEQTRANQYFESAKTETARQLTAERTAIAKDYVAKSTYTSDVTGIRNDLTATTTTANTTKQNLASYQTSNDKAVANLQSNLQTASGNISSLQTKIEAVPGQITSAVSAVEGKIPTSIGGRNLIIRSQIQNGYINANGNLETATTQFTTGFIDGTNNKQFTITAPKFAAGNLEWLMLAKYNANKNFMERDVISYTKDTKTVKTITLTNDVSYFKVSFDGVYGDPFKIERGSLATDWSPAPEDYDAKLDSVKSEIKQTTDAITASVSSAQTAASNAQSTANTAVSKANAAQTTADSAVTKATTAQATANNNANTIGTHTTQINTLNSSLAQKQDKLTAGNGITIQGNVISSTGDTASQDAAIKANTAKIDKEITDRQNEISRVENKIPKSAGGRNLALGTSSEWSNPYTYFYGSVNTCFDIAKVLTSGLKVGDKFKVHIEVKYKDIVPADGHTATILMQGAGNVTEWKYGTFPNTSGKKTLNGSGEIVFESTDMINSGHLENDYWTWAFRTDYVKSGSVQFRLAKAEAGDLPTPWEPAPEDYDAKLDSVKSEIKQTTDAITASVSSAQTAASNAQSTANTAVTKADTAQSTANNNASKITELQDKVCKTVNIDTTNYFGHYSVSNGILTQYKVMAKDGKYIDLDNFTLSDSTGLLASTELDSQVLMIIFEYVDSRGKTLLGYGNGLFTVNDQHKIVVNKTMVTSNLCAQNLSTVKSFTLL